ncbi:acetyltransferase [Colletotrichum melonis]|uniref:Acetyltransferase n=2 Tax=Colletotrichum acutatum species complex TaxID=2707335 RepID=A0AAI9TW18_9PEZI|nr:acetyltransferase [Colletotrichum limetticola]KAK1445742.1 acetyltransferase [Colletotrichum melonis]
MDIQISLATIDDIPEILELTQKARVDMYPHLDEQWRAMKAEQDLATFQKTFFDHPDGAFIVARSDNQIMATVGYQHYDYRFPQLTLLPDGVVEVVRLFVVPAWRRGGLASRLVSALEKAAREAGLKQLYLHTHPFLPGAIKFWERQAFVVLDIDRDDAVWQTTHMSRNLEG